MSRPRNDSGGDARHIDPALGTLLGEGSHQKIDGGPEGRTPAEGQVWRDLPSRASGNPSPTYYERPVLKEAVWIWSIPLYFYVGGMAGAAATLGAAAQLSGDRDLVTSCRIVAATGVAVSSGLLIHDLGRPERFLHMLRVFRPSSPMSVGSWVLAAAGGATFGSAVLARRRGFLGKVGDAAGFGGALLGLPLTGYTAVLLANTAVPLWQAARRSLPPLFFASSASAVASLFGLLPVSPRSARAVRRLGIAGQIADLAAAAVVESDIEKVERVGRPLHEGVSGALWKAAKRLTTGSLVLSLLPGRSKKKRAAAGLLGTSGAIALRFALFHAGKASARDPRATFESQRQL